jgi:hypothetical protein
MQRNKVLSGILVILFMIAGCIEPFVPRLNSVAEDMYVVSGEVTDQEGFQTLSISKASSITKPKYIPAGGCLGTIEDDKGNEFSLEEYETGKYRVWIDQGYLIPGTSYRLRVTTPSGDEILSDFDRMPSCPAIDSVYYEREDIIAPNTGTNLKGLQFYVDVQGEENDSRFYRWTADETWEHHSPYPRTYYYDGTEHRIRPPDYTYSVCWSTMPVQGIFTLTTTNLVSNSYKMLPLHYVDNQTNRLLVGYSVLFTQHALSENAYDFWEKLRINSEKQGSLYEKQPLSVEGNLHNISHPETPVLGFFGSSSVTQKRLFVNGIQDLEIADTHCSPEELGNGGWKSIDIWEYPVYYILVNYKVFTLQQTCWDCRTHDNDIIKPEFWP